MSEVGKAHKRVSSRFARWVIYVIRTNILLGVMILCVFAFLASFLIADMVRSRAEKADVMLIVNRQDEYIELFFGLDASTLIDMFNADSSALVNQEGTVDFDSLRTGTFDLADKFFSGIVAVAGGELIDFESMSLMVHLAEDQLPFNDPVDGMVAISVCSAPTPTKPPLLSDLYSYAGYISYVDDPMKPLSLKFPYHGDKAFSVRVINYVDGQLRGSNVILFSPKNPVIVSTA